MTPCEEMGYKVGDRFECLADSTFNKGSIIELINDDGTENPLFKLIKGSSSYKYEKAYFGFDLLKKLEPVGECPAHYDHIIQPWEYMRATFSIAEYRGYLKGNIIKYISRYQWKGGIADLYKLRSYQEELVKFEEGADGVEHTNTNS